MLFPAHATWAAARPRVDPGQLPFQPITRRPLIGPRKQCWFARGSLQLTIIVPTASAEELLRSCRRRVRRGPRWPRRKSGTPRFPGRPGHVDGRGPGRISAVCGRFRLGFPLARGQPIHRVCLLFRKPLTGWLNRLSMGIGFPLSFCSSLLLKSD